MRNAKCKSGEKSGLIEGKQTQHQTFCYISLKLWLILHPTTILPASILEFQHFTLFYKKKLWLAVMHMLSTSQRFQTILRHNVGNPDHVAGGHGWMLESAHILLLRKAMSISVV